MVKFARLKYVLFALCFALLCAASTLRMLVTSVAAADEQTWSDLARDPIVSNGETLDGTNYHSLLRHNQTVTGNATCQNMSLPLGPPDSPDPQGSLDGCWYNTSIGLIGVDGFAIQPKGQNYAGFLYANTDVETGLISAQLVPTPNPDVFIEMVVDYDTGLFRLYFRTTANLGLTSFDAGWEYPASYTFDTSAPELTNGNNQPWQLNDNHVYSQIAYSNDGKWMSIWDEHGYVVRVNLTDFSTRAIYIEDAPADLSDYAVTSISPSGRYIAVNIYGQPLRLIDTDVCGSWKTVNGVQTVFCPMRFLDSNLEKFTDKPAVYGDLPYFYSDDLLGYYVNQPESGEYYEYLLRAPNTTRSDYIALGDSYASGEGEGNSTFYPETDIHNVNMCHLSKQSYPYLIGADLGLESTHSVACSGAKIQNIVGGDGFDDKLKDPDRTNQYLNSVPNNTLDAWLPGYYAQLDAVEKYMPDIVTISMVGNDIGFKDIIERCVVRTGTCYSSYEDRLELVDSINQQFDRLVDMYQQMKQATILDARIYVIGYPSIVKSGGDCGTNVHLNHDETVFANQLVNYLDSVIKLATKKAGVAYVDDQDVFNGHRLCENSGENRALNGITIGHDTGIGLGPVHTPNFLSKGAFHPTVLGHQLWSKYIEKSTNSFTVPMPRADNTIGGPIVDNSLALLQAPKSNRPTNEVVYDDTTGQVVYRNGETDVAYTPGADGTKRLNPFAPVGVVLHSDPINLGTLTTDANGNISGKVTIPSSVPVGFHAIDLYAMGADGKMHDITQTIYIAATPDDYDGDGVPNNQEPCLIFEVAADQLHGANYDCEELLSDSSSSSSGNYKPSHNPIGKIKDISLTNTLISSSDLTSDETITSSVVPKIAVHSKPGKSIVHHARLFIVWALLAGIVSLALFLLTFFIRLGYAED